MPAQVPRLSLGMVSNSRTTGIQPSLSSKINLRKEAHAVSSKEIYLRKRLDSRLPAGRQACAGMTKKAQTA